MHFQMCGLACEIAIGGAQPRNAVQSPYRQLRGAENTLLEHKTIFSLRHLGCTLVPDGELVKYPVSRSVQAYQIEQVASVNNH